MSIIQRHLIAILTILFIMFNLLGLGGCSVVHHHFYHRLLPQNNTVAAEKKTVTLSETPRLHLQSRVYNPETASSSTAQTPLQITSDADPYWKVIAGEGNTPPNPAEYQFYRKYSKWIGIPLNGTENKLLIKTIAEWMGVPYKWGGCDKDGVDCSCLVKTIFREVYGVELSRTSSRIYEEDLIHIEKDELREGDILCFNTIGNQISHVGIYLKDDLFVHASYSKGVYINSLDEMYFKKRFIAAGRVHQTKLLANTESGPDEPPAVTEIDDSPPPRSKISIHELLVLNR